MLCGWGVKAGMVKSAGKTVWSMSERIRGALRKNALLKIDVYFTYTLLYLDVGVRQSVTEPTDGV